MIDRVKIGPISYTIEEVSNLRNTEGTWLYGEINYHEFVIRLSEDNTHESRFVTLWHETLHAIETAYGLELSEDEVTALATAIAQVLQDNPGLNWTDHNA